MTRSAAPTRTFSRLIVTGGAGFIGSNFVHRTLETCPDVHIHVVDAMTYAANPGNLVGEGGAPLDELYPGRFRFSRLDIVDATAIDALIQEEVREAEIPAKANGGSPSGEVAIVHFAAESHNDNSLRDPGIFARTNVEGTVNLAEAAARHGAHLHHVSTDEVFGDLDLEDPARFQVDSPYRPSSPYSASKAAADHFVRAFVRSRGLKATISNCSNNYGPRQHPEKFIPRQVTGLIEGEKPRLYGAGENVRDWIHVDDHNDAVWRILECGDIGETYLIGAEGERSNRQVVESLLAVFGRPRDEFVHVTDRPGHDRRYAIDPRSMEALGWAPRHRNFEEGLAHTVRWYRENQDWWRRAREASERKYRASEKELN